MRLLFGLLLTYILNKIYTQKRTKTFYSTNLFKYFSNILFDNLLFYN